MCLIEAHWLQRIRRHDSVWVVQGGEDTQADIPRISEVKLRFFDSRRNTIGSGALHLTRVENAYAMHLDAVGQDLLV